MGSLVCVCVKLSDILTCLTDMSATFDPKLGEIATLQGVPLPGPLHTAGIDSDMTILCALQALGLFLEGLRRDGVDVGADLTVPGAPPGVADSGGMVPALTDLNSGALDTLAAAVVNCTNADSIADNMDDTYDSADSDYETATEEYMDVLASCLADYENTNEARTPYCTPLMITFPYVHT
ncbi:hypothetical protein M427DRAFT_72251 [Gonapodya prolifera JEL478]|uniref:Uncharacterized protein n=1 Tax=Gonapodya prolifera (strain JEL478) TaxID=1344416 RepID=A0A139A5T1_GONPJ|nr:hypothetical protein M427DRAFT_72251 [Gonapodya prolifera JEL478]|eukprot:KXS12136.1 hypothetical protein M427DRAFT_72251 [Gonapodya prolifera JEL478]